MVIEFTARHYNAPDTVRNYAENEVKRLEKYNDRITQCQIILSHEHNDHIVELNLSIPGQKFNSKVTSENLTKAVDIAVDKMVVRLKKFMDKRNAH